ncbi:MAG: glycoside hydrolase family 2 protein [Burkholderiales bacterium]
MKKKSSLVNDLYTRWGEKLDKNCPLDEYPRPQMRRDDWLCLNGIWQYAIRKSGEPEPAVYDGDIVVPFSPESLLSGVKRQLKPGETLWYKRTVSFEKLEQKRLLLHFGAVDQHCTVYCNGREAGSHSGGYWPFCFDITELVGEGNNTLTLAVTDDSDLGSEAYGKQKLERGGIWYTAQSGIWQTVWAEYVPRQYITDMKITPDCKNAEAEFCVGFADGDNIPEYRVQIFEDGRLVSEGVFAETTARLPVKGFRFWSPDDPFLYKVKITAGEDTVKSYFGMREFDAVRDVSGRLRFTLNGKPLYQTGLLDQGYWSDGLYTAPSDEAIVWEITELKKLGFNMLRKHIKIEPLRWYYHCDRLGMLVWQDFVSGGGPYKPLVTQVLPFLNIRLNDKRLRLFGRRGKEGRAAFLRDMARTIKLLQNVVSIAVWVPFNEGWGQFDALRISRTLKNMDPTRLVDHASGWHDQGGGDFESRHIYYKKYRMRPDKYGRVQALTEFGGYSCPATDHMASDVLFGYRMYQGEDELTAAYERLYLNEVLPAAREGLAVSVYTQVSDVEDEINGIFTYDRAVMKLRGEVVRRINEELKETADEQDED